MDGSKYSEEVLDEGWQDRPPSLANLALMVRRQIRAVVTVPVLCLLLALAFIILVEPRYTATASLFFRGEGTEAQAEAVIVMELHSHAELIRSEETTAAVISRLGLEAAPGLGEPASEIHRVVAGIRTWLGLTAAEPESDAADDRAGLIRAIQEGLQVSRLGNSRIIEVSFTANSRSFAVHAANAFASVHVDGVATRNERNIDRRVARLSARAEEMKQSAAAADAVIQQTLSQSGQFATDPQELQRSATVLRQQLADIDAESAAFSTKLAQLTDPDQTSKFRSAVLESPEAMRLQKELGPAEERLAMLRAQPGMTEETLARVEESIQSIRDSLQKEIDRQVSALQLELVMNDARHASIAAQISSILDYLASDDWERLEAVRRDRELYDAMYQDYLGRLEAIYREPADRTEISIVSDALSPLNPSFPNYKVVLAIAITLGIFLGLGLGMMREWSRSPPGPTERAPSSPRGTV